MRCKILNPGASAISPTSSKEMEEEEEADGAAGEEKGSVARRGRGYGEGGSAARTQRVYI